MTFKANEIEQYPYLVYTDDAGNVYEPESGGGGGGGGEILIVNYDKDDTGALDKTWNEISNAGIAILTWSDGPGKYFILIYTVWKFQGAYGISAYDYASESLYDFATESADSYPVFQEG